VKKITLLLGVVWFLNGCTTPSITSIRDQATATPNSPISTNFVTISLGRFNPQNIQIAIGESVVFQNLDSTTHHIASDPYPKNDILPDFHSDTLFKNEAYSYTFHQVGTFGYHLEENPSVEGKITVAD